MRQQPTDVFLVGTGLIGSSVLNLVNRCAKGHIRVVGIGNSRKMMFDKGGIALQSWQKQLAQSRRKMDLRAYVARACLFGRLQSVFVDCTASDEVVSHYDALLAARVSIVTPNKRGLTGKWKDYKRLKRLSSETGARFLYDTTVGAGLPVISTLKKLLASGDHIIKIEGVLSGTLSYIFNRFMDDRRFSDVLCEAKERGLTEPDPREDLSGNDVRRKLVILAREMSCEMELEDVSVENLVPPSCRAAVTADDFFTALREEDARFEKKNQEAAQRGCVLRYSGSVEKGKAFVSLQTVNSSHPFYHLSGSDNVVSFTTANYNHYPLVIKGAGAGASVTGAGVFSDIVKAATL